jgi:hypothetical protein
MRKDGKTCEAPGCANGALITRNGYSVCNLHYQRLLHHNSFDLPKRALSRHCTCANCGKEFDRGYAINSRRKRQPQYCSTECQSIAWRNEAQNTEASRFWKWVRIGESEECWEWTGYRSKLGYGRFSRPGQVGTQMAHRIAYELVNGPLPPDLFACHKCDNPPCCNPNHLFAGTASDNVRDAVQKGRWVRPPTKRGTESNMAKLTPDAVKHIFTSDTPARDLAQQFGVTTTAVYWIKKGKNWGWLTKGLQT